MDDRIGRELVQINRTLKRIADTLDRAVEPLPDLEPQHAVCPHPKEARVEFGGMGEDEEWECAQAKGGCGYRYPGRAA